MAFSVSTLTLTMMAWPDILRGLRQRTKYSFHNNRDGTFTDLAVIGWSGVQRRWREQAGMGSYRFADYNADGRLDIFKH